MDDPQPPAFLELAEAAALLRTSPRTLRRWTQQGKVERAGVGRKLLYSREYLLSLGNPGRTQD